eukprot:SAG11_NODE_1299_length_5264_cov_5.517715_3_plen_129_part_00
MLYSFLDQLWIWLEVRKQLCSSLHASAVELLWKHFKTPQHCKILQPKYLAHELSVRQALAHLHDSDDCCINLEAAVDVHNFFGVVRFFPCQSRACRREREPNLLRAPLKIPPDANWYETQPVKYCNLL